MFAESERGYEAANEAFYARFWEETPGYESARPNAEESARAGALLAFLGRVAEQERTALTLLDVGCGRGWLTNLLSLYGNAQGCDLAAGGIHRARQLFPRLTFHHGALATLLKDGRLEPVRVIVSSEVLEHVPTEFKPRFVRDLRAALLPRGHCLLTTPRREMFSVAGATSSQLVEEWLTESEAEGLFADAGFVRRGFCRAVGLGSTFEQRAAAWLERSTSWRRPSFLRQYLDWRCALYQVWWFQRID